jgi:hypothetical protein
MGLIDTGADITLIPEDWAEPLGIQIADCEIVDGGSAAGSSEFRVGSESVFLTVLEQQIELMPIFGGYPEILLGREDFLAHFEFNVDQAKHRFTLKPYDH